MKKHLSAASAVCLTLAFALTLVSCATFKSNSYKTLAASKSTYEYLMTSAGDLYKQGKLEETDKDAVINLGRKFKDSHNAAVAALLRYEETGSDNANQEFYREFALATEFLTSIITFIETTVE